PSFWLSASQKRMSSGESRYWTGVSTVAIAATNFGSATAARAASRNLAITGSGVPAGTKSAVHCVNTTGKPASVSVGTSGIDASRLSPQVASTRSLPALTCWTTVDGPDDTESTVPPRSATTA